MRSQKSSVQPRRTAAVIKTAVSLILPFLLLACLIAAPAGEFWEKKDYKEWTPKECQKMVEDSPWAFKYELTGSSANAAEGLPFIRYTAKLRSALPIRQAEVRLMQIQNKYDSLSPEQKQSFDKQAEGYLSQDNFKDRIVIQFSYATNMRGTTELDLSRHWLSRTTELLSQSVYLVVAKGSRIPLLNYVPPQGGGQNSFTFVFPREHEGRPVLAAQDKSLILEWVFPVVGGLGSGKDILEFKVKKMLINGEVVY
jgi:hypothetical protein